MISKQLVNQPSYTNKLVSTSYLANKQSQVQGPTSEFNKREMGTKQSILPHYYGKLMSLLNLACSNEVIKVRGRVHSAL